MESLNITCSRIYWGSLCRYQKLVSNIVSSFDFYYLAAYSRFIPFFMFNNPDYLRSESYQIRKQAIEKLGDKDGLLPTNVAQVINVPYSSPNMFINQDEEVQDEK